MLKFITFAVKTQLNVHDLNNETGAGNVTDIRLIEFLDEGGNKIEAPAVSGRMLKHWHYEAMRHLINHGRFNGIPLCAGCTVGEPIKPGEIRKGSLVQVAKPEKDAIASCVSCDVHGYLIAQGAQQEGEGGVSSRRTSRALFSWLMPVVDSQGGSKQVVHTRVSQQEAMAAGEGAAQMIFSKSYASGIYAFVSALDAERTGLVEDNLSAKNPYAVQDKERRSRLIIAIEAYRYLISGQLGASLSHAIPHSNPIEMLVAYSENGPLPFPVSPMYSDYIEKTKGLMPAGTKLLYWNGQGETKDGLVKKNTIDEIFAELSSKI